MQGVDPFLKIPAFLVGQLAALSGRLPLAARDGHGGNAPLLFQFRVIGDRHDHADAADRGGQGRVDRARGRRQPVRGGRAQAVGVGGATLLRPGLGNGVGKLLRARNDTAGAGRQARPSTPTPRHPAPSRTSPVP